MSFSSDIKQELNKNSNLSNKELVKFELIGYLISKNTSIVNNKFIKFTTESDYNINRFSKLLSNLNVNHSIDVAGKAFVITFRLKEINELLNYISFGSNDVFLNDIFTENIKNKKESNEIDINMKALIRGVFLRLWIN